MGTKRRAIVVGDKRTSRRPWLWVDGKWSRPVGVSIDLGTIAVPGEGWMTTEPNYCDASLHVQEVANGPWWDVMSCATLTAHHRRNVLVWELRRR